MNADKAKIKKQAATAELYAEWTRRAIKRAEKKIEKHIAKGYCELDLKFPPSNPDDDTSEEVAHRLKKHLASENGYRIVLHQRVNHLGVIVKIHWD